MVLFAWFNFKCLVWHMVLFAWFYSRYAEEHDPVWIDWYRQYYDCLYGENPSGRTAEEMEATYPGVPKGYLPQPDKHRSVAVHKYLSPIGAS